MALDCTGCTAPATFDHEIIYLPPVTFDDVCHGDELELPEVAPDAHITAPRNGNINCVSRSLLLGYGVCFLSRPYVDRACTHNAIAAVKGRVIKRKPLSHGATCEEFEKFSMELNARFRLSEFEVMTYDEWLESMGNTRLVKEYAALKEKVLSGRIALDFRTLETQSFIKKELLTDDYKVPRCISGRSNDFTAYTGPWIKSFGRALKKEWSMREGPFVDSVSTKLRVVYATGMDPVQMGAAYKESLDLISEWTRGDYKIIETDFSKFDSCIDASKLMIENRVYESYGCPSHIIRALEMNIRTTGSIQTVRDRVKCDTIKYGVEGTRKSGDNNTSCGNSLLNAYMQLYAYNSDLDMPCVLWVHGDDSLLFTAGVVDVEVGISKLERLGMKPEVQVHTDVYKPTFCSKRFYPCIRTEDHSFTYIAGPKIGRVLMKAGWNAKNKEHTLVDHYSHLLGTCSSYIDTWRCIPILYDYFVAVRGAVRNLLDQEGLTPAQEIRDTKELNKFSLRASENYISSEATFDFMMNVYGLTPGMVDEAISCLQRVVAVPCVVLNPVLEQVISVDVDVGKRGMDWDLHTHDVPSYFKSSLADAEDRCFCGLDFKTTLSQMHREPSGMYKWVKGRVTSTAIQRVRRSLKSRRDIINLGAVGCANGA